MNKKILLYGGTGLVGSRVAELLSDKFEIIAPTHSEVDLTNPKSIKENINQIKPDQILYAAGYTNVDKAEEETELCNKLNSGAVEIITESAKNLNSPLHYLSTDYVFDGTKEDAAYIETDTPNPLGVYAKSKRDGEDITLKISDKNSVLRLIMPYSAVYTKKLDLARTVLSRLKNKESVFGVVDQNINPIFVDDLIMAIGKILENQSNGIYHLGASSFTTPMKFIEKIAELFDLDKELIIKMDFAEFSQTRPAKRPQHSWLDTSKFINQFGSDILHTVGEGLELFKKQIELR